MGQGDVIKILEEDKEKWFSLKELQQKLGHLSPGSVCVSVKKLRNANMVFHELRKTKKPLPGGSNRHQIVYLKHKEWED